MAIPFLSPIGNINISDGTPQLKLTDTSSSATTTLTLDGVNLTLQNNGTDGDFTIRGKDGSSYINLLAFDTSAGGNATFAGTVTTDKIFVAKGQNLAHVASSIITSQESTAKSQIRFYGADTSTAGILEFVGSTSNGSSSGARLTLNADGSSTFAGSVGVGIAPAATFQVKVATDVNFTTSNNSGELRLNAVNDAVSATVPLEFNATNYEFLGTGATTFGGNVNLENASSPKIDIKDTTNNVLLSIYSQNSNSIIGTYSNHPLKLFSNSSEAVEFDTSQNATFTANVSTAAAKRISIGTWDNSAFTGGAAEGYFVEGTTPMLILEETDQSKTGYMGMSSGNMYVGGIVNNFYVQTNDGTTRLTIDSSGVATFEKSITMNTGSFTVNSDTGKIYLGADDDMEVYHTGTSGYILNKTGSLYLQSGADDNDMYFQCDNGSGGLTNYLWLDGSAGVMNAEVELRFPDGIKSKFGSDQDFLVYHDGNNAKLTNSTGGLYLGSNTGIGFQSADHNTTFLTLTSSAATYNTSILMGNTVTNPASGFADQTGIGLKYSTTVPEIQISSDSTSLQLGRTSTGGQGQIMNMRYASNTIHDFGTNYAKILQKGTGSVEQIWLGMVAGSGSGSATDEPIHKTVLGGYSVDWSGGTRLSNEGFLMWHSGGGWTGHQRHWAMTNAYDIGGTGGPKFALLLGNANTVEPTLGSNGALGTNTQVATYWKNTKEMVHTGAATFEGEVNVPSGKISILGGNNLTISGTASNHAGLSFGTNIIYPATAAGTNDNTFDLGDPDERFKDAYFGGTVNAANVTITGTLSGAGSFVPVGGGTFTGELTINNAANNNNLGIHIKNDNNLYSGALTFWTEYSGTDTHTARIQAGTDGTDAALYLQVANTSKTLTSVLILDHDLKSTFAGALTIPEYIVHSGDSDTFFGFVTNDEYKVTVGNSTKIFADANAAYLYYQGNQKIRTTSTGVTVTGGGDFSGSVDIGSTTSPAASNAYVLDVKKAYSSGNGHVAYFGAGADTAAKNNFDTVVVAQDDVPCLAIVEGNDPNTHSTEQALRLAVGDNNAVISSTVSGGLRFMTNRSTNVAGYLINDGVSALHLANNGTATFAGDVGMVTGHSSGKFAVKSTAVHGSFDFYNDGTTYLNGTTTVDADLRVSGTGEDTFIIGPQSAGSGTILMSLNAAENAYEPLRLDVETFKVTASGGTSPCIIETSGLNTTFGGRITHPHKKYCDASISNSYVRIYSTGVTNSQLATIVRLTGTAHGSSHVGSFTAKIMVSHYRDVQIESMQGFYPDDTSNQTRPTLKVEGDGNGQYTLSMKTGSTNAATYYFTIESLSDQTSITTLPSSTASTTITHEHICKQGKHISAFGRNSQSGMFLLGGDAEFEGKVGIPSTTANVKLNVVSSDANWTSIMKNYTTGAYGLSIDCSGAASANYVLAAYSPSGTGMFLNGSGNVGIGITTPQTKLQVNGAVNTFSAHFGGQNNTNGQFQGISLGYAEGGNANYRKVAIVAEARGDGAARQNLHLLVDTANDGNSASLADAKMTIDGITGNTSFASSISITGTVTASSDIVAYSDERLKTDVETLDGSKVYNMRGVSFTKDDKKGSGVIAQELEKIAPELVNNDSEFKSVAYGNITGYLIEAIKDLKAEVEELKKQIK